MLSVFLLLVLFFLLARTLAQRFPLLLFVFFKHLNTYVHHSASSFIFVLSLRLLGVTALGQTFHLIRTPSIGVHFHWLLPFVECPSLAAQSTGRFWSGFHLSQRTNVTGQCTAHYTWKGRNKKKKKEGLLARRHLYCQSSLAPMDSSWSQSAIQIIQPCFSCLHFSVMKTLYRLLKTRNSFSCQLKLFVYTNQTIFFSFSQDIQLAEKNPAL